MNHTAPQETLSGLIERVTFHSTESGFCVLRIKVSGKRELVTVVGSAPSVRAGEYIEVTGSWFNNKDHGFQFKAETLTMTMPNSLAGIEKYLGSGLIKGIGKHFAQKLVARFGTDVITILDKHPEKLKQVEGIGGKRFTMIMDSWGQQRAVRQIMLFLAQHGVGTGRAFRIYKTYGEEAIALVTADPYRLAKDIKGIGFKVADQIAATLHIEKTAMIRARAGISYTLQEALNSGHCALPVDLLLTKAQALLDIPTDILTQAIQMEEAGRVVQSTTIEGIPCVALASLYHQEKFIATRLKEMPVQKVPWAGIEMDGAITWVEKELSISLSETQKEAIHRSLATTTSVITGGPGVGKTTLLNSLIQILSAKKIEILLAAPTGRAAKRMSESTGKEAKTIHRLLQFDPQSGGFKHNEHDPLSCDLLVLDEVSMIDIPLMFSLLKALPPCAGIIFVGDVDQLPSVGPGRVLHDVIASGILPVTHLTEVFRQAKSSQIIMNAHLINKGEMPHIAVTTAPDVQTDFYFVASGNPEEARNKIIEIVKNRLPKKFSFDPMTDIQVLSPMNKGGTGVRSLNVDLQAALNPLPQSERIERFGVMYGVGDKVMQTQNNYDKNVFNGDIGYIQDLNPTEKELTIVFDGKEYTYDFDDLDQIALAYAITIHKSQGSEYPAIVIPFMMQHFPMLKRNLLYTGITRGKKMVVLVAQEEAISLAVNAHNQDKCWSKLKEWLV